MLTKTLTSILEWLRAGYPEGVPATDYFPLLALLKRQLSDEEVKEVVRELVIQGDEVTKVDIGVAVSKVTNEVPSPDDIRRVATRLVSKGFPLQDPTLAD